MPTLPTPIQHSTGILIARVIRQEEEIKRIQIGTQTVKVSKYPYLQMT
jgi:hypothetical protein